MRKRSTRRHPIANDLAFILLVMSGSITAPSVDALPSYTITDLGTLGGNSSSASDINNSGQVVGSSVTSQGKTHAFRYSDSQGMKDLGVAPTREIIKHDTSSASGINDKGQVVGGSRTGLDGLDQCFRYTDGVGMVNLTELHNRSFAATYGSGSEINNFGQVVGWERPLASVYTFGVLFTDGQDHALIGAVAGDDESQVMDINDNGQLVGYSFQDAFSDVLSHHAFRLQNGLPLEYLGTLGGKRSVAIAVNNNGQIAGYSTVPSGFWHGFLFTDEKRLQDLGVLKGDNTSTTAEINIDGIIVGSSSNTNGGLAHPVVWTRPGCPESLNDAPGIKGSGWVLGDVRAINDHGQIVGYGRNPQGQTRAVRLEPQGPTTQNTACNPETGAPDPSPNPTPTPTPDPTPTPNPTPNPTPTPSPNPAPSPNSPPAPGTPATDAIEPANWRGVAPSASCTSRICKKAMTKYGRILKQKAAAALKAQRAADKATAKAAAAGPDTKAKAETLAARKNALAARARLQFDLAAAKVRALHD